MLVAIAVIAAGGYWPRNKFSQTDPFLWLQDAHGEKAPARVDEQNARKLKTLGRDPGYAGNFKTVLSGLGSPDRIPFGRLEHRYVFNFWRDATHPRGIWRGFPFTVMPQPSPVGGRSLTSTSFPRTNTPLGSTRTATVRLRSPVA